MHIETGHALRGNIEKIESNSVRFVAEDGLTMFEVSVGDDGRSIEVRGVDSCKVDGVMYAGSIDVRPKVANCVDVCARRYDDA